MRHQAPEILFNPTLIESYVTPIHQLVVDSILKTQFSLRNELVSGKKITFFLAEYETRKTEERERTKSVEKCKKMAKERKREIKSHRKENEQKVKRLRIKKEEK